MKTSFLKSVKRILVLAVLFCISFPSASLFADSREITLIGTTSLGGFLDPHPARLDLNGDGKKEKVQAGGISRLSSLIKEIKAENPGGTIVLSGGSDLMRRYFHLYRGEAIFSLMSAAGYEILGFGNHDFDKGPKVLADALKYAEFERLCTDLKVKETPLENRCMPFLIREYQGLKIGFFSLMTEDFPIITNGGDVTQTGGNIETARRAVEKLRKDGARLVVGLIHDAYERAAAVASAVPGIDILFGSLSSRYSKKYSIVGRTILINGGENGDYLVRFDFKVDDAGRIDTEHLNYRLIPVDKDVPVDKQTESLLAGYRSRMPETIVLGKTGVEWDLTKKTLRQGESPIANLVNDQLRKKFEADIVLNNGGAFRGKKVYPPGIITDARLREIDEFGNHAIRFELRGKYIKPVLERSAACFDSGGFLHASGVRYAIDLKKAPQKIDMDTPDRIEVTAKGRRVTGIEILDRNGKWTALDPERFYRVVTNSFLVNKNGDGYFWFKQFGNNFVDTRATVYSILSALAESDGYVNPGKPDGRLRVMD
jgi:5'-nucleotidase / UDP-sugar diphosphatase